jgi:hypothetical protein
VAGTFSLALAHLQQAERACDILLSLAWTSDVNEHGVPGTELAAVSGGAHAAHTGHGGLSPWAIRTVCFGAGAGLGRRAVLDGPFSQVDLAPTILALKGVDQGGLQGRVLAEAFTADPAAGAPASRTHVLTTENADGSYRAELRLSTAAGRRYLDEGRRLAPAAMPSPAAEVAGTSHP